MATFDDFQKLEMRVGEIIRVEEFPKARKPAYKIWVDFGEEIGIKQSSAQITECYEPSDLIGKQVLGVVNFPPMRVAGFSSEVLVMGVYAEQGVVLIEPQQKVKKGDRLG
ncbi:TPA: tRNA-binding protein [Bacillus cereus]|uniref:tRNA-binding protein n=1 Tax=Bacillus thuringiensis TaxID=1428 RepID=A0A437SQ27_BACTU|nr:tRNA-binding protein [Bacillus thuringiensis]HDR4736203.1 tRNA-binding protein [Bacillus cereus]MBG9538160.1 molecular chaperone [Bacillus thuringiensis]MBG9578599.1 molecular chaperone [Bacillus thuringiensis]RVU65317.1 tRNA-binding protein [Bacillus thuringiensis]HDR4741725.1 tRNA-binding protein [Bacillus cereus]